MSKGFAVIYGEGDNQILVLRQERDDRKPEVRYFAKPSGMEVCSVGAVFSDTNTGRKKADELFESLTLEKAQVGVAPVYALVEHGT